MDRYRDLSLAEARNGHLDLIVWPESATPVITSYSIHYTKLYEGLIDNGVVEVAPLAFMRGRTLNDAFVILDEAQNTTTEQMKSYNFV